MSNAPAPLDNMDLAMPTPWQQSWSLAKRHIGLQTRALIVLVALVWAVFAPWIAPADPYAQDLANRLAPAVWQDGGSWAHVLGTDGFGRDVLSRLIWGTQVTMVVGFGAAVISGIVGSTLGMLGGYLGGRVDAAVIFLINVKLAMPGVLIALSLVSIFGGSLVSITIILSLLFWDRFAVVTRTAAQQVRTREFIADAVLGHPGVRGARHDVLQTPPDRRPGSGDLDPGGRHQPARRWHPRCHRAAGKKLSAWPRPPTPAATRS